MANYTEILFQKMLEYEYLGLQTDEDGSVFIGKAPHIAPKAWLHKKYRKLSIIEIDELGEKVQIEIPIIYKEFLNVFSNGLNLFSDSLSLDGLRSNYNRDIDIASKQPYSIITPNITERFTDASSDMFFFGGYCLDGSLLYFRGIKIYKCARYTVKPTFEWNSFEEMILLEFDRLALLFDKDGKEIEVN